MTSQRRSRKAQHAHAHADKGDDHGLGEMNNYNAYNTHNHNNHINNNMNHHFMGPQAAHTRRRRVSHNHAHVSHGHNHHRHNHNQKASPQSTLPRPRHRRHRINSGSSKLPLTDNQNSSRRLNPEPTFSTTVSDLIWIICEYTSRFLHAVKRSAPRFLRKFIITVLFLVTIFSIFMGIITLRFIHTEAVPLCTPPLSSHSWEQGQEQIQKPPLVEYYVHGRGNGHYARSVAIVEQLLSKGVDVRMFIGRATMWRAVNEAHGGDKKSKMKNAYSSTSHAAASIINVDVNSNFTADRSSTANTARADINNEGLASETRKYEANTSQRGQVTVTSVASLLPSMSFMDTASLLIERVMSDCEIAKNTNRYPVLVISDGDLPGMWRAKYGSIPSVSVSHGQTFVIGHMPEWASNDAVLSNAWKKQRTLNSRTSSDANWLIGTNFVDIPVNGGNGVVARSPMRPEVMKMGNERQLRKMQKKYMDETGNVLAGSDKLGVDAESSFMTSWQKDELNKLLFGDELVSALKIVREAIETKKIAPIANSELKLTRRKLVICYFRDKNGDLLTNALLRSGFDVLLFERGYHKGLSDPEGEKFGQNLMVHREPNKHATEIDEEVTLNEYWGNILHQYDRKLLGEDNFQETNAVIGKEEETDVDDEVGESILETDSQVLENAIETVTALLKSDTDAPRIIRVTDMSLFVPLLSIADGVASSAGSQLLSECIYSHLNVLALHREDDTEQRLNIAFSKHRFDRLSKDGAHGNQKQGTLNAEHMGYYASENVVHGMSLEKFARVFETISRHEETKGVYETILTENEEAMLLRTPGSRQTYADFKTYVEAVRQSPISWSYYHDLFWGLIDSPNRDLKRKDLKDAGHSSDSKDTAFIDPFRGMTEPASVILEIIDDLSKKNIEK